MSAQTSGNIGDALGELLKGFGVTALETGDGVRGLVVENLLRQNLQATVLSLRYGKLTLGADALTAQMLRFEKDNLLRTIEEKYPGEVTSIVVKVQR